MKNTLKHLEPTKEQSEKMWREIEAARHQRNEEQQKKIVWYRLPAVRYAFSFVVVMGALFFSGVGINAATNGQFVEMLKESMGITQSRQDVLGQAVDIQERGIEVFAPEILWLDSEYLMFGTHRGIVIYDIQQDCVVGTIDTQAVDCVYFDSDEKSTHLVKNKDVVVLFNSENGKPFGNYYEYKLSQGEGVELAVARVEDDEESLSGYYEVWKSMQNNYNDTFESFAMDEVMVNVFNPNDMMYSRRCFNWQDEQGIMWKTYLQVKEDTYSLVSYNAEQNTFEERVLHLESSASTVGAEEVLEVPPFTYSGENKAIKAICDYMFVTDWKNAEEGVIYIPGFVIFKEVEENGEYLVFGNFWYYGYQLNGNMLESTCGGEMPACFHLIESEDGYSVVSVDQAGDGTDYMADIEEFTKNYEGLADMYSHNDENRTKGMLEYARMYVTDNELDVKYIKEFGWDPIPLFE